MEIVNAVKALADAKGCTPGMQERGRACVLKGQEKDGHNAGRNALLEMHGR